MEITIDIPRRKQHYEDIVIPQDTLTRFENENSDSSDIFVNKDNDGRLQRTKPPTSGRELSECPTTSDDDNYDSQYQPQELDLKSQAQTYQVDRKQELADEYLHKYQKAWYILADDFPVTSLFMQLLLTILIIVASLCQFASQICSLVNVQLSYTFFMRNLFLMFVDLIVLLECMKINFIVKFVFQYLQVFTFKQTTAVILLVLSFWNPIEFQGQVETKVAVILAYITMTCCGIIILIFMFGRFGVLIRTGTL